MKILAALGVCCALVFGVAGNAFAKAHLILVYQAQTESSLAHYQTTLAQNVADRIAAIPGYDARVSSPVGSPGQTARSAGAEDYLVVKLVSYDDGSQVAIVSSFLSKDDEPVTVERIRLQDWALPSDFNSATLIDAFGGASVLNAASSNGASATNNATSNGTEVMLPGGTQVIVHLTDKLTSASATANDTFAIQASQDVVVNGWILIKKGAPGQGTIVSTEGAAGNGSAGKLTLRFDFITGADGLKVQLSDSNTTETGEDKKGASSTATIIGYAFLGLPGLFMHNMVRGRQMEIDPSMKFTIFVDHNVHIAASEQAATPSGFAK